jgi:hypothetical protein
MTLSTDKKYWIIKVTNYPLDGDGYETIIIYFGTWFEAARICIRDNEGIRGYDPRSVTELVLKPRTNKSKSEYIVY